MSGVDDSNCGIKGDASKVKMSGKTKSVQVRGCECPVGSNKRGCCYFVTLQGEGFSSLLSMGAWRQACAGDCGIDGGVEQMVRLSQKVEKC